MRPNQRSEVDIRVSQEIKNNKDLMYDLHQKINNLKEENTCLLKKFEGVQNKAANELQSLSISFENLKDFFSNLFKDIEKKLGIIEKSNFKTLNDFNILKDFISLNYINKEDYEQRISKLEVLVYSNELKQNLNNNNNNKYFEQLRSKIVEDINNLRNELIPKVPEIDPIKAQLDERFQVWKVDFDGVLKEIALIKKALNYDQKKFENVYTLIERLKESKKCQ